MKIFYFICIFAFIIAVSIAIWLYATTGKAIGYWFVLAIMGIISVVTIIDQAIKFGEDERRRESQIELEKILFDVRYRDSFRG